MLFPQKVETLHPVWPISNFVIMGLCVLTTGAWFSGVEVLDYLVLDSWNPLDLMFSTLLHGDILHITFNLIYLWVFGNAICSKFGNAFFLLIFFGGAAAASAVHLLMDGYPAIGASGAVNAVIGVFLVLYPVNRIHCIYWIYLTAGTWSVKAYWLISFWFALDIFGAFAGRDVGIAFWAHIGGFLAGVAFGFAALKCKWVKMDRADNVTLLDIILKREPEPISFKTSPTAHTRRRERPAAPATPHGRTDSPEELARQREARLSTRPQRRVHQASDAFAPDAAEAPALKLKSFPSKSEKPEES